jgi:fumarylacetoacetase
VMVDGPVRVLCVHRIMYPTNQCQRQGRSIRTHPLPPLSLSRPFICPTSAGSQTEPAPLPYLHDPHYSSYDITLEVALQTETVPAPHPITRSNFRHLYWDVRQQLVHHAVTGCNLRPGDLLGSGTIR